MAVLQRVRSLAYDAIARRDGLSGWQQGRAEFRALAASSARDIEATAQQRLAAVLMHAAATVPHYRDAWRALDFTPSPATAIADLRRLPLLTKADVRDRKERIVSKAFQAADLVPALTGGTTGTQTEFFRDRYCNVLRTGRQWGVLERCGYTPGSPRGLLWGVHADIPTGGASGALKRFIRYLAAPEQVLCCTRMTAADMTDFHRRLRRSRPPVMYAYPRALEEFARFIARAGLAPLTFERILCTAEMLSSSQRRLFTGAFGAEVFNLYCSREHGCVGFECSEHDGFHVDAGSVVIEILRNGTPAAPGEQGEVVVTDLLNYGMPFIRYVTGDLAAAAAGPCRCGSSLPRLQGLYGRVADMLYLPDGGSVAGLMLDDLFTAEPSIIHSQFVQEQCSVLDVNLVVAGLPREGLGAAVEAEVRDIVGRDVEIRIHYLADIPRNPRSGKYQQVISKCRPHAAAEASRYAHV